MERTHIYDLLQCDVGVCAKTCKIVKSSDFQMEFVMRSIGQLRFRFRFALSAEGTLPPSRRLQLFGWERLSMLAPAKLTC